mgnify:CR=1 FL=1
MYSKLFRARIYPATWWLVNLFTWYKKVFICSVMYYIPQVDLHPALPLLVCLESGLRSPWDGPLFCEMSHLCISLPSKTLQLCTEPLQFGQIGKTFQGPMVLVGKLSRLATSLKSLVPIQCWYLSSLQKMQDHQVESWKLSTKTIHYIQFKFLLSLLQ